MVKAILEDINYIIFELYKHIHMIFTKKLFS